MEADKCYSKIQLFTLKKKADLSIFLNEHHSDTILPKENTKVRLKMYNRTKKEEMKRKEKRREGVNGMEKKVFNRLSTKIEKSPRSEKR